MKMGSLKHDVGNDAKYGQRDTFLNNFELDEIKGTSILNEAKAVGWYLAAVFKKGNAP